MMEILERNKHLDSLMETRNQQRRVSNDTPPPRNDQEGLSSPFPLTESEISENSSHPPPTPLTIRSKRVIDSPNHEEREGTPSKRREVMPNEVNPLLGELEEIEAVLSRNDKAQGLDPRLIIHGKQRRGQKP